MRWLHDLALGTGYTFLVLVLAVVLYVLASLARMLMLRHRLLAEMRRPGPRAIGGPPSRPRSRAGR